MNDSNNFMIGEGGVLFSRKTIELMNVFIQMYKNILNNEKIFNELLSNFAKRRDYDFEKLLNVLKDEVPSFAEGIFDENAYHILWWSLPEKIGK